MTLLENLDFNYTKTPDLLILKITLHKRWEKACCLYLIYTSKKIKTKIGIKNAIQIKKFSLSEGHQHHPFL